MPTLAGGFMGMRAFPHRLVFGRHHPVWARGSPLLLIECGEAAAIGRQFLD
jgi:hypothetical protein